MAIFWRSFGGDGDDGRNGGCIIELPQVFVSETIASLAPRCFAVWMDARAGDGRAGGRRPRCGRTDGGWKMERGMWRVPHQTLTSMGNLITWKAENLSELLRYSHLCTRLPKEILPPQPSLRVAAIGVLVSEGGQVPFLSTPRRRQKRRRTDRTDRRTNSAAFPRIRERRANLRSRSLARWFVRRRFCVDTLHTRGRMT